MLSAAVYWPGKGHGMNLKIRLETNSPIISETLIDLISLVLHSILNDITY